ncbi:AAA family ATPase [Kitasatospora sp. NPDC094011]|uniref:AAA family ATPase n=1 Tax=Kitasatospora sp. NPDC094011 TaxID=3364090 RepID=UPI00382D8FD5
MITQIRIDGFKSFVGFELDVHPVTVLLGVNGAGKSNLFDALRLVSGTVHHGFDATVAGDRRLAVRDLFHRGGADPAPLRDSFRITVGAVVPSADGPLPVRLRMQAHLVPGGSRPGAPRRATLGQRESRIWVSRLENTDWMDRLGYSDELRADIVRARDAFTARTGTWAATVGGPILGDPTVTDYDELFGTHREAAGTLELLGLAARETASWRPYVLEPGALRELGRPEADGPLEAHGGNLAVVLDRIAGTDPERYTRLLADLAALVPGVRDIRTEVVRTRGEYDFEVEFQHTGWVSPASLSDGTLRALALLAAYWDRDRSGVLAVEEIENGMHLSQVADLVRRLGRESGLPAPVDRTAPGQLLVTTHSPALLAALRTDLSGGVVFLDQANHVDPERRTVSRITTARPLRPWDPDAEPGGSTTPQAVERLLHRLERGAA